MVPIPGTTSLAHLEDDLGAASLTLSAATIARLNGLIDQRNAGGARYGAQARTEVDTEEF